MEKDHIFLLGKVFGKEVYADDFISKGRFICNTLNYFKNYEDKEINNIGDIFEGIERRVTPSSGAKFKVNGCDIDYKELHFHSGKHLNMNVFCLYGPNIKADKNITFDNARSLIEFPEDTKNLGEYFVLIHKPEEFCRRVDEQLSKLGFSFRSGCVEYRDLTEDFHILDNQIGFIKASEYSHQKEFRYLIDTGRNSDKPIFVEIGSISDIAFKTTAEYFNKNVEIKLTEDN